jgi:hypothetical protein
VFGNPIWQKTLGACLALRYGTDNMNRRRMNRTRPSSTLLGLALDAKDGQKRITRGPNFFLAGGSQETHGVMQETAIKVNEHLDRKGKRLTDVSLEELRLIVEDIHAG